MSAADAFYVTTPIYYVNDAPHIGHAYTTLACDAIARFARLDGRRVRFLTGTDEHGQKVEKAAAAAGKAPQAFTDEVSERFRDLARRMRITNDDFIRTTEPRHRLGVQALWRELVARDQIYLGTYAGWYSVRDELFYTESELVDGRAPTGAPVEWVEEPSYFFRLSAWQRPLLEMVRGASRLHPAGRPTQRGGELRPRRPAGPVGVAHQLRLGRAGAGRSQARRVRLAGRADQLHDRARLSRPRR